MSTTVKKRSLLQNLQEDYPDIVFVEAEQFFWSPKNKTVSYKSIKNSDTAAEWALLHEVSHAILNHSNYSSDFELLKLEVLAWVHAKKISGKYKINISEDHIQDCLDTYRDWLHRRSTCPRCGLSSLQTDTSHYKCHSCSYVWSVSKERFCRPYRRVQTTKKQP